MNPQSVAVVTGANRGLGLEVARQLTGLGFDVVVGARDAAKGRAAADRIGADSHPLDVADDGSVAAFAQWLRQTKGRLDVLVNNAAVHYDTGQRAAEADLRVVAEAVEVNLLGAWRATRALVALMTRGGRIVNVSSGAGSFGEPYFPTTDRYSSAVCPAIRAQSNCVAAR